MNKKTRESICLLTSHGVSGEACRKAGVLINRGGLDIRIGRYSIHCWGDGNLNPIFTACAAPNWQRSWGFKWRKDPDV